MTVRVFHNKNLEQQLASQGYDIADLKADFKQYKETGSLSSTFGRDVEYDHPYTPRAVLQEKISHIHLSDSKKPWNIRAVQFHKKSDIHLVYCRGFYDEDCYLLMALLAPNAHEQALDSNIMNNLARMAEIFRNKY